MRVCSLHGGVSRTARPAVPKASHGHSGSGSRASIPGARAARQLQLQTQCMQAGAGPGPGMAGRQPPMGGQDRAMGQAPAPLARRPAPYAAAPQQPIYLELTQVLGKQVITRTSGRCLGVASAAWLDPARCQLVSLDLDERRGLSSTRVGNIPLSSLRQIGDVVLVHDESALYEQDLDGRLGFVNPVGLEVRTRSGEFLGKVRDVSFSPDNGEVARLVYDEFGLATLPLQFFDCYSVSAADILSLGRGQVIVFDDAKYRERKENNGIFAVIPTLLKSVGVGRTTAPQLALPAASTTDAYRLGSGSMAGSSGAGSAGYLPADYSYEQWQQDLRRWEQETGMTYEQYLRSQQAGPQAPARAALPAAGRAPAAGAYGYGASPYQQQQQPQPQRAPQQQQQYAQRTDYGQYAPPSTSAPAGSDGRFRAPSQQVPQQQPGGRYGPAGQPGAPAGARSAWGAAPVVDPRQRSGTPAGPAYAPQQQQQQQQPLQPGGYSQRTQPPYQQQTRPPTQQQAPVQQQQPQPQQQQQQQAQQPQGAGPRAWDGTSSSTTSSNAGDAGGRPVNEWIDRDNSRPRMAEVLGDGLVSQADAAASQRGGPMGSDGGPAGNGDGSAAGGGSWEGAGPQATSSQQYGGGMQAAEAAGAGSSGAATWPS